MATTRLSDVIVPSEYARYQTLESTDANRFFASGIVTRNPVLDARANGASNVTNIPFWKRLDSSVEPNISSDNPADKSIASKITAGLQVGYTADLNQSWSSMDLASSLSGEDVAMAIVAQTNQYWATQFQKRLVSASLGLYQRNAASESNDMSIYRATSGSVTDSNRIGSSSVIEASATAGDAAGSMIGMAVHSAVFARLQLLDLITYVQPSADSGLIASTPQGNPMYQGKMLIVDDGMPVWLTGSNATYLSVLFGAGAFGYGEGTPPTPVEVSRDATSGNGGGEELLHERKRWLLHPFGYKFNAASMAGGSPTLSELALAANWERVVPRKNVPLAFLVTNG